MITDKIYRLLIIDDDIEICNLLVQLMEKHNYKVFSASNGADIVALVHSKEIDLVVLDIMLPGEDGLTLCRKLRATSNIPIIMLTAAGEETDRIIGLEIGADDYLTKPFNPRELIARIKAVLRRSGEPKLIQHMPGYPIDNQIVEFADWRLDMGSRQLLSSEHIEIILSSGEYILLATFIAHPQKVLSRDKLLEITQHRPAGPFDRSVDIQVSRLRQKIEADPKKPKLIKTVRGGGYLFTPKVRFCS